MLCLTEGVKMESFDVIIIGAGLSGIGAAVHLQQQLAKISYRNIPYFNVLFFPGF
jgi:ribulose 1,5-bisphosphate synthetase/thiazole synthase